VARVQALIATTTTVVVSEAAARRGEIDAGVVERLTPALENAQLAWSRSARRWAELTTPASRTDPALVEAAGARAIAADHPGLAAPARVIAMRAQGEAEVARSSRSPNPPAAAWSTSPPMSLQRSTRPWLQPLTSGPPSLRRRGSGRCSASRPSRHGA
jgi:hypothetical protein